jgi:hypothetical protein
MFWVVSRLRTWWRHAVFGNRKLQARGLIRPYYYLP